VVFLKDTTLIEMEHNANNIVGSGAAYIPAGLDVGRIVIRPDGDRKINFEPPNWIQYSEPFSFSTLNYSIFGDAAVPVVGTTGGNGVPQTLSKRELHYYRGVLDSVGDEWHTLTVADDDIGVAGSKEFIASDGKVHLFVINPKTPCLSWAVTGNGQFYTTPAKTYFVPHIYDQTTYFVVGTSGTVTCTIRDINGNNIFYRINGGSFTDAGANYVTLDQDDFNVGENTLEYYYAGNSEFTRTRTVVKNPAYPSAGETHGDRLWLGSSNFDTHIKEQLKANWWMTQWRTSSTRHLQGEIETHKNTGRRTMTGGTGDYATIVNALVARCYGMNEKSSSGSLRSFAEYAKLALLEPVTSLDPVGIELSNQYKPMATKELMYRGYYDVLPIFSYAGAYDIIAGYFRADQGYANGLTAIEDYFIRDALARWVHLCGLYLGGFGGTGENVSSLNDNYIDDDSSPGMWTTASFTGATMIACMMPNYASHYYGTSGMDRGIPMYESPFFFPNLSRTWFEVFVDEDVPRAPYPYGQTGGCGFQIQFTSEGKWHDRIAYIETSMCGMPIGMYYNMLKMYHPAKTIPNFDLAMGFAATGNLMPVASPNEGPAFRSWSHMLNAWHPEFRAVAQPAALALDDKDQQHPSSQMNYKPYVILYYDHNLPLGIDPSYRLSRPSVNTRGGVKELPFNLIISHNDPIAEIYYTTDGSDPTIDSTIYTTPFTISTDTTIKAIAIKEDALDSFILSVSYTFPLGGRPMAASGVRVILENF
jgi:hypothetical protein